jgi:hypothetical protein
MKRALRLAGLMLVLAVVALPRADSTQLVLKDGTVLEGIDVKKLEGNYILTTEEGEAVTIPAELVETVKLTGVGEAPSGMRTGEPKTLAGDTITPPRRYEQVENIGPSARFQEDVVDNSWRPSTDWSMDPDEQNDFAPSTWSKGPVDPEWKPKSSWDANEDVLASGRSEWRKSIVDPHWKPTDGFAESGGRR